MGCCGSSEQAPAATNTQAKRAKQSSAKQPAPATEPSPKPVEPATAEETPVNKSPENPKTGQQEAANETTEPAEVNPKPTEPVDGGNGGQKEERKEEPAVTEQVEKSVNVAVEPPQTDEPSLPAERAPETTKADDADDAKVADPQEEAPQQLEAAAPATEPADAAADAPVPAAEAQEAVPAEEVAEAPEDAEAQVDGAEEKPEIQQRPSVAPTGEPRAAKTITIERRPLGFGAMNGPQYIGAQITSIKNTDLWQNKERPESWLKAGQYIATIESVDANYGKGGVEDVKYAAYKEIGRMLKKYQLPIVLTFWEGPEVSVAFTTAFEKADINEDGHITWDEFQKFSSNFAEEIGVNEAFLHEEFDRYAKDQDGNDQDFLDVETFKLAISHITNDWDNHALNPANANKSE